MVGDETAELFDGDLERNGRDQVLTGDSRGVASSKPASEQAWSLVALRRRLVSDYFDSIAALVLGGEQCAVGPAERLT